MVVLLADEAALAQEKVLALMCLTPLRDHLAPYESRLRAWTAPDQPIQTRKFATHAMGLLNTPSALREMDRLLQDAQQPVRETAMGVMWSFHPEIVEGQMQAFWDNPETTPAIRDQVILGMPPHLVERFIGLYGDAVADTRLSPLARLKAVNALGQLGNAAYIPALEKCVNGDPDEAVKARARGALALLRVDSSSESVVSE